MSWRLAHSLEELRTEINAAWPARNKDSDGTIGDVAHAATASDHNPNGADVVCAFDITHDPNGGPDGNDLSERLRQRRHPDAKYIIWNGRICSAYQRGAALPWEWRPYSGADPHTNHIHVSVGVGRDGQSTQPYDDTVPWLTPAPTEDDELTDQERMLLTNASDKADKAFHQACWLAGVDPDTGKPTGSGVPALNRQMVAVLKHLGIDPASV